MDKSMQSALNALLDGMLRLAPLLHDTRNIQDFSTDVVELTNHMKSIKSFVKVIFGTTSQSAAITREILHGSKVVREIIAAIERHIQLHQEWNNSVANMKQSIDKADITILRTKLDEHVARLRVLVQTEISKDIQQSKKTTERSWELDPDQPHGVSGLLEPTAKQPDIIIAVIGETGSGKSSFIQQVTQSDVKIGHSLEPETRTVQGYSITVNHRVITLVDTPGFDDTYHSSKDVVREVSSWLTLSNQSNQVLNGIIYLHRITSARMSASMSSFYGFYKLVGPEPFHNILLVTTWWNVLGGLPDGEAREEALLQKTPWKHMIERGTKTARYFGDRQSALAIITKVAFDQNLALPTTDIISTQQESGQEYKIQDTKFAEEALGMDVVAQQHEEDSPHAQQKNEPATGPTQQGVDRPNDEVQIDQPQPTIGEVSMENKDKDVQASIDMPLEDDQPESRRASQSKQFVNRLVEVFLFAITPIVELQAVLQPMISKALRPRPQKGYSRLEWTCSCGGILYGDYIEGSPGSLQKFAAELGGRVISAPALQQVPVNAPGKLPQPPPSAHIAGTSTGSTSQAAAGQPSGANQQAHTPHNPAAASGNFTTTATQPGSTTTKWLELCIRSGPDTFMLGEIDITTSSTDQAVFKAIKEKYESSRIAARLFGRFAYRIPNGGVTVRFLKDKLVSSGSPPTASIMARSVMPDAADALKYKYVFDPTPMDQPPIDTRTFNHYFHKPHVADPSQKWVKRLPQLHGASLFWSQETLAKGWGIEITEERNWMVFVGANIAALLLSGSIAGLSAHYLKDNPTGVAIGAWLTAVQALSIAALFFRWTG